MSEAVAEAPVDVVEEQVDVEQYGDRLIGRTKAQKEREARIRDNEREYWIRKFTRLGDGRANRTAPKEERQAFRKAAALIAQNQDD